MRVRTWGQTFQKEEQLNNSSIQQIDVFQKLDLPIIKQLNSDERTEWVMVTPDVAKKLLGINYKNQRNVSQSRVEVYARDMEEGHWNPQSQYPIRISSDGQVIDGQHRLLAVIKSGISIPMEIKFGGGNASELFDYVDNTLARTAAQFIGSKNATAVSALSRSVLCLLYGAPIPSALKGAYKSTKVNGRTVTTAPTRFEIIEYSRQNQEKLGAIVSDAKSINRATGANPLAIGLAMWCIHELRDARMLSEYVEAFKEIAPENRTVAFVQASVIRKISKAKQQRVTVNKNWSFGVFAYGYDAFVEGREVKSIRMWEKTLGIYSAEIQTKLSQELETENAD